MDQLKFIRFVISLRIANENLNDIIKDLIKSEVEKIEKIYDSTEEVYVKKYMHDCKKQEKEINKLRRAKRESIQQTKKDYLQFSRICNEIEKRFKSQEISVMNSATDYMRKYLEENVKIV